MYKNLNVELRPHIACSIEEKIKMSIPLIGNILELSRVARGRGILALEEIAYNYNDTFFAEAIMLMVDSLPPTEIKELLYIYIEHSQFTGVELLNHLLIIEGIVAISKGQNPNFIKCKLELMLGDDIFEIRKRLNDKH